MKKVTVFAPATIANLGCGFDVMGMALDEVGDILEMSAEEGDGISIVNSCEVPLPNDIEKNVITPVIRSFLAKLGRNAHINVDVKKKIFPGSGIGSSAASSAAAAYGMNELFERPFSVEELVEFAMEGERLACGSAHADNAAPAVMGGAILVRGYNPLDIIQLPVPDNFYCSVVHPHIVVTTKESRSVLPNQIPLSTAITQWGNLGGLVAGFYKSDVKLIGRAMKDVVAEPHRKQFIPGFDALKEKLLAEGALCMNISGSGPSVFALSEDKKTAEKIGEIMKLHFKEQGIDSNIYVMKVSDKGAKTI